MQATRFVHRTALGPEAMGVRIGTLRKLVRPLQTKNTEICWRSFHNFSWFESTNHNSSRLGMHVQEKTNLRCHAGSFLFASLMRQEPQARDINAMSFFGHGGGFSRVALWIVVMLRTSTCMVRAASTKLAHNLRILMMLVWAEVVSQAERERCQKVEAKIRTMARLAASASFPDSASHQ